MTKPNVTVTEGIVVVLFNDSKFQCSCCADGKHGHSSFIKINKPDGVLNEDLSKIYGATEFVNNFAAKPENQGKRVRITVEILD